MCSAHNSIQAIFDTGLEDALLAAAIEESTEGCADVAAVGATSHTAHDNVQSGLTPNVVTPSAGTDTATQANPDAWSQFTAAIVRTVSPPDSTVPSDSSTWHETTASEPTTEEARSLPQVPTAPAPQPSTSSSSAGKPGRQKPLTKREKKVQKKQQKLLERRADARGDGISGGADDSKGGGGADVTWDMGVAESLVRM